MFILVFDTETTGLPKKWNGPLSDFPYIIQISWILYDTDLNCIIEEYDQYIKLNNFSIPAETTAINGITDDIIQTKGINIKDVLIDFMAALDNASLIIGHNVSFDKKMIEAEFERNDIGRKLDDKNFYCTMRKAGKINGKIPKLGELHEKLFGFVPDNLHNSKKDVEITLKCYLEQVKK